MRLGSPNLTILVLAKAPAPGRVKTRLTPPFTPAQAAALATAALRDTLAVVLDVPARHHLLVLDGKPGSWLPPGLQVRPQCAGTLDERIAGALAGVAGPTLLVGMDTPQLTPTALSVQWAEHDAWFGPAADGGFWALGLREPDPALVLGVAMSRPDTGAVQLGRLLDAGLRVGRLPRLRDVDTATDAAEVAALAPHTHFAACHRQLSAAQAAAERR